MTILTVKAPDSMPQLMLAYKLAMIGFEIVDNPNTTKPERKERKGKTERTFQAPLIIRKADGTTRELDPVTVEKEMKRVLRQFTVKQGDPHPDWMFAHPAWFKEMEEKGVTGQELTLAYIRFCTRDSKPEESYTFCEPQTWEDDEQGEDNGN